MTKTTDTLIITDIFTQSGILFLRTCYFVVTDVFAYLRMCIRDKWSL